MIRLLLLASAGAMVFLGCAALFVIQGIAGVTVSIVLIALGSWLFWLIAITTRKSLDKDTWLNRILNTDA